MNKNRERRLAPAVRRHPLRARLPASVRRSQRIEQLMNALEQSEENATFSKLAMRKVITSGPRARARDTATGIEWGG